jgi:solute carrier family 35, member F5
MVEDEGAPLLPPLTPEKFRTAASTHAVMPALSVVETQQTERTRPAESSIRVTGRHILGACLLILVAAIWVGAAVLVQYIFDDTSSTPWLFLTTVNVSEFVILLPVEALLITWRRHRRRARDNPTPSKGLPASTLEGDQSASTRSWANEYGLYPSLRAAAIIAPIWLLAQSTYNWALAGVSASTSTVLATTSCVWTFALSVCVLHEPFEWTKAAGVVLTLLGAVLVSLNGANSAVNSTWWGIALSLCSAVAYGCYTTCLRKLVPEDGPVRVQVLFGCIGALCGVTVGPIVAVLHVTGVMRIPPLSGSLVALILCKGLFDNVLSDVLWAWAIQLTSATLATIGLALTIPLAMVSDLLVHGTVPGATMAGGSCLVVLGFFLTTVTLQYRGAAAQQEEAVAPTVASGREGVVHPTAPGAQESTIAPSEE